MSKHRLNSMLYYGVAALVGAALMVATSMAAIIAVAMPFAIAAAADRFVNGAAETDERMRSFVAYLLGGLAGLLAILVFGAQLGTWTFVAPLAAFAVAATIDYLKPPAKYRPSDPHRYGESPPVTLR